MQILWNEWVEVPNVKNSFLKLKLDVKQNLSGKIFSSLFKSPIFYVDYELADGYILTYRFIASNAEDGLWASPFLIKNNECFPSISCKKMRLRSSEINRVKKAIKGSFEAYSILDNSKEKLLYEEVNCGKLET